MAQRENDQKEYKKENHIYSACLSPESVATNIYLAGLLACFLFTAFPSRINRDSGCSVNSPV